MKAKGLMGRSILSTVARVCLPILVGVIAVAIPAKADSYLSGTYDCKTVEIAGKVSPCSAPSLELSSDGSGIL